MMHTVNILNFINLKYETDNTNYSSPYCRILVHFFIRCMSVSLRTLPVLQLKLGNLIQVSAKLFSLMNLDEYGKMWSHLLKNYPVLLLVWKRKFTSQRNQHQARIRSENHLIRKQVFYPCPKQFAETWNIECISPELSGWNLVKKSAIFPITCIIYLRSRVSQKRMSGTRRADVQTCLSVSSRHCFLAFLAESLQCSIFLAKLEMPPWFSGVTVHYLRACNNGFPYN
jgi:hypothetical protein